MKLFSSKSFKQKAKRFICLFLLLILVSISIGSLTSTQKAQAAIDWNNGSYWHSAKFTLDIQNHVLTDTAHNVNYKWFCMDTSAKGADPDLHWFGSDNAHFFIAEGSSDNIGVAVIPNGGNRAVVRGAVKGLSWTEVGVSQASCPETYIIDPPLEVSNWKTYSLGSRALCNGQTSIQGYAHAYDENGQDQTDKISDAGFFKNNSGNVMLKWIADGGDQSTKLFNSGGNNDLKGGYQMKCSGGVAEGGAKFAANGDDMTPEHPLNNLLPWGTYKITFRKKTNDTFFIGSTQIDGEMTINFDKGPTSPQITGPDKPTNDSNGNSTAPQDVLWGGRNNGSMCNFDYNLVAVSTGLLEKVMRFILGIVSTVIKAIIAVVSGIVNTYAIINTENFFSKTFIEIWRNIRDICNILFVLVLLGIAFMNFLGEGIDAYTIKKLLPRFLIAIIIINFSLLMCKVIVDFSNVLSQTFKTIGDYQGVVTEQTETVSGGIATAEFGAAIVSIILAIIGLIAGLLLAFLLIFRVVMIWLLVMISPFVFLLWVLPPTQPLFSKWWDNFIKYVFMGPVVVLILAMAKRVSTSIPTGDDPAATTWIKLLFSSGMIIAAAAVPLALGGMAMQKVAGAIKGVGKRAGGMAWGATGAKAVARGKEGYMAQVGEKRGPFGKIPRTPRARAKASAELSKVRAPIYDQMDDETTLAKKAKRGDVQAALMLARHERTDLLDPNMVAKHPSLQQMVKTQDPIGAGLKGDALKSFLDKADASQFTDTGVKNLLENNQKLSDHHISAIATRGNQSAIDALHEHYATHTHKMPSADSVAGRAVLHSALASKNATQGSKIINNMNATDFGTYLKYASPNQVIEWQNSGVIDNLNPESLKELRGWGEINKVSLNDLQDKGEISKDFFSKITK